MKYVESGITSEVASGGQANSQHPPLKDSVDVALSEGANGQMSHKR